MLTVISPAKTLDFESSSRITGHSQPDFLDQAGELIEHLRQLSPPKVAELMTISTELADLNFGRYLNWHLPFSPDNARQALLAFRGDVYQGIQADAMSGEDLEWLQDRLRILSGLYGLLRPLDLIQPYRLEMGTRLANCRGADLYRFWGDQLTVSLNRQLAAITPAGREPVLVNLASKEYFRAVSPRKLQARVITPVFRDWKRNQYRVISFFAKKARGMMVNYLTRQRIEDPELLKQFTDGGYRYQAPLSSEREWVFTREMDQGPV